MEISIEKRWKDKYLQVLPEKSFQTLVQILAIIIMQWLDCVDHEIFRPTQLHFGQG